MKTTVIYHSADFDGIFCREIARKFLPDAELIGWNFGDPPLKFPESGDVYVLDLPVDRPFGFVISNGPEERVNENSIPAMVAAAYGQIFWIDHHKSSIDSHPSEIPGYRIDGVAACRLVWQWFRKTELQKDEDNASKWPGLPSKQEFVDRIVIEPWAVRLAGEYDIWDKRDADAELFQHGLRSEELYPNTWDSLLSQEPEDGSTVVRLLNQGRALQFARTQENASIIKELGFTFQWEGLTWLACNHARYNSLLFTAGLTPEHDACFGFKWTGKTWSVSLYHATGKEHHDLSLIAVKYKGGGHKGACGFQTDKLPFL